MDKKKDIFLITTNGKKRLIAKNVYVAICCIDGLQTIFFVKAKKWKKFKKKNPEYTAAQAEEALLLQAIPKQSQLVGNTYEIKNHK